MKYACLIYDDEANLVAPGTPEFEAVMAGHMGFSAAAGERIQGGEALEATSTATTVTVREGETVTTDGPFAETKEQLGGECDNLDEAIALAAQIPEAASGRVEVRPCMDFG